MRRVIAGSSVLLTLCATVSWGRGGPPPARWWDEWSGAVTQPAPTPGHREFPTVEIDPLISYIRYLFMHKQALILEQGGEFYFYYAYNDAQAHVSTKVFAESDVLNPAAWIVQDILEWPGPGTLRYISPTAYWDGAGWYPQVTFNAYAPSATFFMYDQGGLGAGLWTAPMDVSGPVYDYYLPITETATANVVGMDGQARCRR